MAPKKPTKVQRMPGGGGGGGSDYAPFTALAGGAKGGARGIKANTRATRPARPKPTSKMQRVAKNIQGEIRNRGNYQYTPKPNPDVKAGYQPSAGYYRTATGPASKVSNKSVRQGAKAHQLRWNFKLARAASKKPSAPVKPSTGRMNAKKRGN